MSGRVSFGYVPVGYLGSNLGPFILSPVGKKVQLLEMARLHSLEDQPDKKSAKVDRRPNMPLVEAIISAPAAVWFTNPMVPEEVNSYFNFASRNASHDFKRLCDAVILLPHLTLNGEWVRGFEFSLVRSVSAENGEQWSKFLEEAPKLLPGYRKTMFVNRMGPLGGRLDYQELFITMAWALGRIKLDAILTSRKYSPEILNSKARDIYAYIYTKEMGESIGLNSPYLNKELLSLFAMVPQNEIKIVLRLLAEKKNKSL